MADRRRAITNWLSDRWWAEVVCYLWEEEDAKALLTEEDNILVTCREKGMVIRESKRHHLAARSIISSSFFSFGWLQIIIIGSPISSIGELLFVTHCPHMHVDRMHIHQSHTTWIKLKIITLLCHSSHIQWVSSCNSSTALFRCLRQSDYYPFL